MQLCHFIGLELGQAQDHTALALLQRPWVGPDTPPAQRRPAYALRYLRRFPLGTSYPDIVRAVRDLFHNAPLGCKPYG